MKMKIAAVVTTSLIAASSFAQTGSLASASAARVDETVTTSSLTSENEVAAVPLLAAFALGMLAAEVAHHHFVEQTPVYGVTGSADVLFDR